MSEPNPFRAALALLEAGRCIWCEHQPRAAGSYLCPGCRMQDPAGVLASAAAPAAAGASTGR